MAEARSEKRYSLSTFAFVESATAGSLLVCGVPCISQPANRGGRSVESCFWGGFAANATPGQQARTAKKCRRKGSFMRGTPVPLLDHNPVAKVSSLPQPIE